MSAASPVRLLPEWREKIWGSTDLSPLFPARRDQLKIGEVWFPREGLPVLVKFLFTSEKLSVQVHPPGKAEMWHVLRADPGAAIAVGLNAQLEPNELWGAAFSGAIAGYLNWIPVKAGDSIFCDAGTVHSIGPGLALCEIQQNLDVTYRLFDFGRGRELHIDEAVAATRYETRSGPLAPAPFREGELAGETLVSCEHFTVERLRAGAPFSYRPERERPHLLAILEGCGIFGGEPYAPGSVFWAPGGPFEWAPVGSTAFLRVRS